MWDEPDEDGTDAGRTPRARHDERLDLPLRPGSEAASALPQDGPPPPKSARKKPQTPFPEWAPAASAPPERPRLVPERRVAPSYLSQALAAELPESPAPAGPARPGVGARALAGLLDGAVVLLVGAVTLLAVRAAFGLAPGTRALLYGAAFAGELSLVALVLSLFLFGRTPGLALASLRVEEPEGVSLRISRALARPFVSLLLLAVPGISLLVAALREDRASATDLLTGTVLLPED